jgi:CRP-like cAMP-binding protein/Zn-dependent protease
MTLLEASCKTAETMSRLQFLAQTSPFAELSPDVAVALAERLTTRDVAAGAMILDEGQSGEECYLIREGEVAILGSTGADGERERGRIGPGGLFGEMALLSDGQRTASVRAASDCQLLVLGRAELMEAMAADRRLAERVIELIRFRDRPRRAQGVLAFRQTALGGEDVVILKDPAEGRYFRLSVDGWRLWQAIDGELSVRDLIVRQHAVTGRFEPQRVTDLVERLAAAGFVETIRLPQVELLARPPLWRRIAARLTRFFTWDAVLTGCDGSFSRLYAGGVRTLFTPLGLTLLAAIAMVGFALFVFALFDGRVAIASPDLGGALLGFFYVAIIASTLLHEAGHAFVTKHFGGEVDRVGIGWFWFGPVAFVNTSDMWTKNRRARVAVDLAGIAVNAICAGLASFAALLIAHGPWSMVLWQFVLASWWTVLANLNPLFEYDGFYALTDLLDRPNLRRQALAVVRRPADWGRRRYELVYALAGLVFIAVTGALAVGAYRNLLEPGLARLAGERLGDAGGWLVALAFLLIAILQFVPGAHEQPFRGQRLEGSQGGRGPALAGAM